MRQALFEFPRNSGVMYGQTDKILSQSLHADGRRRRVPTVDSGTRRVRTAKVKETKEQERRLGGARWPCWPRQGVTLGREGGEGPREGPGFEVALGSRSPPWGRSWCWAGASQD